MQTEQMAPTAPAPASATTTKGKRLDTWGEAEAVMATAQENKDSEKSVKTYATCAIETDEETGDIEFVWRARVSRLALEQINLRAVKVNSASGRPQGDKPLEAKVVMEGGLPTEGAEVSFITDKGDLMYCAIQPRGQYGTERYIYFNLDLKKRRLASATEMAKAKIAMELDTKLELTLG